MKNLLKKTNPRVLLTHMIITLGYPAARAFAAEQNRLQLFTDAMTVIAMALLVGGILYGFVLRGDLDISGFVMRRGMRRSDDPQNFAKYKKELQEKREDAFNYPLFLGILYLAVSAVIAYGLL